MSEAEWWAVIVLALALMVDVQLLLLAWLLAWVRGVEKPRGRHRKGN